MDITLLKLHYNELTSILSQKNYFQIFRSVKSIDEPSQGVFLKTRDEELLKQALSHFFSVHNTRIPDKRLEFCLCIRFKNFFSLRLF